MINRFLSKVNKTDSCWLWLANKAPNGYGMSCYKGTPMGAHRLSYILHHGPIPQGVFVLHTCDVKHCVNPNHLYLGNHIDNMRDGVLRGRFRKGEEHPAHLYPGLNAGERNGRAKLNEFLVRQIKQKFKTGLFTKKDLASHFRVTDVAIGKAIRGETWQLVV